MLRAVLHTGLFFAGMLGTAGALLSLQTIPFHDWLRPKVAHAVAQGDRYDTLVFGTSRFNHGIDPRRFDARMRELGHPCSTFNLAFRGMRGHDVDEVARWVVERRLPALRRAIVELGEWDPGEPCNWLTPIPIDTHTLRSFLPRVQSIFASKGTFGAHLEKLQFAVAHTLVNALSIGQGPALLSDLWRTSRGLPPASVYAVPDEGFLDIERTDWPAGAEGRKSLLDNLPEVARTLADKAKDNDPVWLHGGFNFAAWERLDRLLRDHGIEPVYVVMPALMWWWKGRDTLPEITSRAIVLDFDDPALHPSLYDVSRWFDRGHLKADGAAIFSAHLADCLVERLPKK